GAGMKAEALAELLAGERSVPELVEEVKLGGDEQHLRAHEAAGDVNDPEGRDLFRHDDLLGWAFFPDPRPGDNKSMRLIAPGARRGARTPASPGHRNATTRSAGARSPRPSSPTRAAQRSRGRPASPPALPGARVR